MKKWILAIFITLSMAWTLTLAAAAAELPESITLYAVDEALEKDLKVPSDFLQSYSLAGHTWTILEGKSIHIDEAGNITIAGETWYYHQIESGWWVGSSRPSGSPDEISRFNYNFGDSIILVDGTKRVIVHAVDYAGYYARKIMNDYLSQNITADMTEYQIAELCCRFVASYNYSPDASSSTGMIVTGGGDCWASTDTLLYMLHQQGIVCASRNASADAGAGSRHMNVIAQLDGHYYILEAGYEGTAPRNYTITPMETSTIFTYQRHSDSIYITGLVLKDEITDISIPSEIDGYTVTGIADGAFSGNDNLVTVKLPDTITYLGVQAFYQTESLRSIDLPEGLQTIGKNCFAWDESLIEVNIPSTVTEIGLNAFVYCDALTAIHVDENNAVYHSEDGVLFDKTMETLLVFPDGKGEQLKRELRGEPLSEVKIYPDMESLTYTYTVPNGVKSIATGAFARVIMKEVYLPDTLTEIQSQAFYMSYISQITIPNSILSISSGAFQSASLQTVSFSPALCRIEDGAFYRAGIKNGVVLPENLEYIGALAFAGVFKSYIRVPASVQEIGSQAFDFQYGWSSMGESDDKSTSSKGAIFFDKNCKPAAIGENAFGKETLCVYPDSYMQQYAQQNSLSWYSLSSDGTVTLKQEWLKGISNHYLDRDTGKFYVHTYTGKPVVPPFDCLNWETLDGTCPFSIKESEYKMTYSDNINIGTCQVTLTGVGFLSGTLITSFYIAKAKPTDDVIDRSGCGLQYKIEDNQAVIVSYIENAIPSELVIPQTLGGYPVKSIDYYAFENCTKLTNITISTSVTYIAYSAFQGCDNLQKIFYTGNESQWKEVNFGNTLLKDKVVFLEEKDEGTIGDVKEGTWQYPAVEYVYLRKIMLGKGFDENGKVKFAPNDTLSREEFAQILYAEEGKPEVIYTNKFSDVTNGNWYTKAILWAAENGIVSGYNNSNFGVGDRITREQLAAMLYKYAQYKQYDTSAKTSLDTFEDAGEVADWAVTQLQWAVANKVMAGKGKNLDPSGTATRAECAAMLRTFLINFEG